MEYGWLYPAVDCFSLSAQLVIMTMYLFQASVIDKETKGSCPMCQHWFMIACLLGERQDDLEFKVFTVQADCPPPNFVDRGWSKKFPVVEVTSGRSKTGKDIGGMYYDTSEELGVFFESINTICPFLKEKNAPNVSAMKACESIYTVSGTLHCSL